MCDLLWIIDHTLSREQGAWSMGQGLLLHALCPKLPAFTHENNYPACSPSASCSEQKAESMKSEVLKRPQ